MLVTIKDPPLLRTLRVCLH